jgi:hypothetical protein
MDIFFENRQKDRSSVTARKTNREKSARKTITNLGACETFGAMRFDNWRLENLRQTVRDR